MSNADTRNGSDQRLPPDLVHELRNQLGVAIATADLALQDTVDSPMRRDLVKIRAACLKAIGAVERANRPAA